MLCKSIVEILTDDTFLQAELIRLMAILLSNIQWYLLCEEITLGHRGFTYL